MIHVITITRLISYENKFILTIKIPLQFLFNRQLFSAVKNILQLRRKRLYGEKVASQNFPVEVLYPVNTKSIVCANIKYAIERREELAWSHLSVQV